MSSHVSFSLKTFPARVADLEFSMSVPEHWVSPDLPAANDDYSDPTLFVPLTMFVAPMSPVILAVAARPAYENGTLLDWVPYLLNSQNFVPTAMGLDKVGSLKAMIGSAYQAESDIGPRHLRFVFIEDGGRLINLFLTCPAQVEGTLQDVWEMALRTFTLARPRGQTAYPPDVSTPAESETQGPPEPPAEDASSTAETASPEETASPDDSASADTSPVDRSKPRWWYRVRELELQNKLEEAEQLVKDSIPHLAFAYENASMYRERMIRLRKAGDDAGAKAARERAVDWIHFYAAQATSGGEGAALSLERDEFLAQL